MDNAALAAQRLRAAHRALRADPEVQFTLAPAAPPAPPPAWLEAMLRWLRWLFRPIGRAIRWLSGWMPDAPFARILLWTVIVLAIGAMVWTAWQRVREGEWRWPGLRRRRAAVPAPALEEWVPETAPARAWLREADALAAAGRYAEAAHCLLIRSVEDLARRRPRTVRPALTSRELARAEGLPERARICFSGIAALVERSLFGGRTVGPDDWTAARNAYAEFALPGAWQA